MNDIDIIRTARNRIASGKWWKGSARNHEGGEEEKVCADTALYEATYNRGDVEAHKVVALVERFVPIKSDSDASLCPLAMFNDHPSTTLSDVVDVFDKALAELRGL